MELAVSSAHNPQNAALAGSVSAEQMLEIYRLMFLSRGVDDREITLKRQRKVFFQVSCAGHEALQVGAALALRPGYDWFFPYYRDRALCVALGVSAYDMLLQSVGAADDPASGGRQMPTHWSSRPLHIVTTSSCTGTQRLHAFNKYDHIFDLVERFVREEFDIDSDLLEQLVRFQSKYVINFEKRNEYPYKEKFNYDFLGYLQNSSPLNKQVLYDFAFYEDKNITKARFLESIYFGRKRNFGKAVITEEVT